MIVLAMRGTPLPGAAFDAPCYRIPAMTLTASGRLVVAFDVRADHLDLPGTFDIVLTASDDLGATWTPLRFLRRHDTATGFGDASLTLDPATGRLWCFYASSSGGSLWDDDGLALWQAWSDDGATTWTHRRAPITLPPGTGGAFASSGNGCALSSGRLLQPVVLRPAGTTRRHAVMAISDDHGDTWRLGEPVPDCDENKVIELADGSVLMHARDTPRRRFAISYDGGETFNQPEPHPDLPDPSCNGGLARLEDSRIAATLLDPPPAPLDPALDPTRGQGAGLAWGRRENLIVHTSSDEGLTWTPSARIDQGPAAYSVAVGLPDGSLGVVYERGDYAELVYKRVELPA